MKHSIQRDESTRFSGTLRHYHRSNSKPPGTWDDWVDGKSTKSSSTNWLKISIVTLALLAVAGVIVGLIIELR